MAPNIHRRLIFTFWVAMLGSMSLSVSANEVLCCPFCSTVGQTVSEEMTSMDAVVIAELAMRPMEDDQSQPGDEVSRTTFRVLEVLKGDQLVKEGSKFETLYFGDAPIGSKFIVMAVDPAKLLWSTPLLVSDRAVEYFHKLQKLPKEGVERLEFFQNYLEDEDNLLSRDAYDEFAKTPYDVVKQLKPKMHHDQLIKWIKDLENVPASRRRLYLTLLGVCGTEKDIPFLEGMLTSADKKVRAGLDALVACYLTLRSDDGVKLIEDQFLKNKQADYAETYATIMALRFHATETEDVSKQRIVEALRCMLDRPELADLVIPDLARLEDWDSIEPLMNLYRNADEKSSWVRVPVINYLRACPDKELVKPLLEECEKIDPMSMKRANTFFPFGGGTPAPAKSSQAEPPAKDDQAEQNVVRRVAATEPVAANETLAAAQPETATADTSTEIEAARLTSLNQGVERAAAAVSRPHEPVRWTYLLGIPGLIAGAVLFTQWRILCFAGR